MGSLHAVFAGNGTRGHTDGAVSVPIDTWPLLVEGGGLLIRWKFPEGQVKM